MGGIFSRTVVVDLTTQYSSELKQIETSLSELQERKQQQLSNKRRVTRALVLYGSIVWLILAAVLYVIDFPNRTHVVARALKIGPVVLWPIMLFLIKSGIDSYYTIQFKRCDAALAKLEKSKETKLDELMARTNFKATQQLISQFSEKKKPSPAQQQQMQMQQSAGPTPSKGGMKGQGLPPTTPAQQGSKYPSHSVPASAFKVALNPNQQMAVHQGQHPQQMHPSQQQQRSGPYAPPPTDQLVASRTSLDRVLDFVLGDGPNNKYALICTHCGGHNGLVREQDLGKVRFRCAMCGAMNGPPMTQQQIQQMQQMQLQQQQQQQQMQQQQQHQQQHAMMSGHASAPQTPASSSTNPHSHGSSNAVPLTPSAFPPLPPASAPNAASDSSSPGAASVHEAKEGVSHPVPESSEEEEGELVNADDAIDSSSEETKEDAASKPRKRKNNTNSTKK